MLGQNRGPHHASTEGDCVVGGWRAKGSRRRRRLGAAPTKAQASCGGRGCRRSSVGDIEGNGDCNCGDILVGEWPEWLVGDGGGGGGAPARATRRDTAGLAAAGGVREQH